MIKDELKGIKECEADVKVRDMTRPSTEEERSNEFEEITIP